MTVGPDVSRAICRVSPAPSEKIGDLSKTIGEVLTRETLELIRCPGCDLYFLRPAPTDHDLQVQYVEAENFLGPVYRGDGRVKQVLEFYSSR